MAPEPDGNGNIGQPMAEPTDGTDTSESPGFGVTSETPRDGGQPDDDTDDGADATTRRDFPIEDIFFGDHEFVLGEYDRVVEEDVDPFEVFDLLDRINELELMLVMGKDTNDAGEITNYQVKKIHICRLVEILVNRIKRLKNRHAEVTVGPEGISAALYEPGEDGQSIVVDEDWRVWGELIKDDAAYSAVRGNSGEAIPTERLTLADRNSE